MEASDPEERAVEARMLDAEGCARVDEQLQAWQQGDCVVGGEHWFVYRTNLDAPLTEGALEAAQVGAEIAESQVRGLVVTTQTCDLVRGCQSRPFVEVSPLVELEPKHLREVERGRRPNYAFLAGLEALGLVADLDRSMTVEKAVVAGWERVRGCPNQKDVRRFALALARKRARAAFPDDFVAFVEPLRERLEDKHDRNSPEGRALRALREVRVRAAPSWEAEAVELTFFFIRSKDEPTFEGKGWGAYRAAWLKLVPPGGRFIRVEGVVQTLDDLSARDYVESDLLDLDHLSNRGA